MNKGGMGMSKKPLTCTVYVRIDGELHKWSDLSPERQKEVGIKLNKQAMEAIGFKAVENEGTA